MAEPFLGQIIQGGWNFAPRTYASCSGQLLSIQQNAALFSLLGTTYGGNGTTNFALPDLRSRTMYHWGNGAGLTPVVIGQVDGAESVTLTTSTMPMHTHTATYAPTTQPTIDATTAKGSTAVPAAGSLIARAVDDSPNPGAAVRVYAPSGSTPVVALGGVNAAGTVAVATAGSSIAFGNMPPYLVINHVIALQGIFPSRN